MSDNLLKPITLANRYQIKQQLSQKISRKTYLAKDSQSQNLVIIKILQFDSLFQWDDFKLFEREAKTLQNLNHPAIPQYLDYFELDENTHQGFALVQTYIDAPSLEKVIQDGRKFSEAELIELAIKLLDILSYLHQQNPPVIHRDLKPSNILITNRSGNSVGDVYLIDFGSVQTVASKEQGTITIVGSYGYIPLEQFGGQTTTASDLYSLGMTLIYLITGIHPAELPSVNGRVKFKNNQISKKFTRWLEKITEPYLDKRFTSATEAKTDLQTKEKTAGNFLQLKPKDSHVKLYRDRDIISITYQEGYCETGCLGCFSWSFILLILFPIIGQSLIVSSLSFVILILLAIITTSLFFYAIYDSSRKTKANQYNMILICIEKNREIKIGKYYKNLDNIKWQNRSYFKDINLLAYNPGYTFDRYLDATGKVMKRGTVIVNPQLSIYANHVEYSIKNSRLSQAELWWLGKELSDFLELELQVIYSTPQEPPEPSCGGGC
jgi:serine/threonine protein kinase